MTNDETSRVLQRLQSARDRGQGTTTTHVRLHDVQSINLYIGLLRDMAQLAKLRLTEEGDREAIRAEYEIQRLRLETEMRQVELAILQEEKAFDALRQDIKEIVKTLIEQGEIAAAVDLQKRFIESFGGSTLDKLISARSSKFIDMKVVK